MMGHALAMKTVLLAVMLAACGCGKQSPAQQPVANPASKADAPVKSVASAVAKMTAFRDQMCTCADKACIDRISQDMTTWAQRLREQGADINISDAEEQQIAEIADGLTKCMTDAMTRSGSSP
jgi:hypothetical protein